MSAAAPPHHTLADLFASARPSDDGSVFLRDRGGADVSYGDLDREVRRFAGVLRAHEVGPGERVAVQAEKSVAVLALYLACLRVGAVFLPLNPAYGDDEVAHVLADAEPALCVVDPALVALHAGRPVLTLAADGSGSLSEAAGTPPAAPIPEVNVDGSTVAALLYTSGTTGRPKGVPLTHRQLAANAATLVEVWGFTPDDVLLHALPVFHAHGLFVAVHCVLAAGASLRFHPRFDAADVIDDLPRSTVFMGVPTHYARLLAHARLDRRHCAGVRLFVSGSAPLTAAAHEAFRARTGHAILERYGMTETLMLTSNPLHGERRPGTVGLPLPGVGVRIGRPAAVPGAGEEAGADGSGAVEVSGPSVFDGYWRRPELRATEFTADGWFRTGDLGRFDDDGYLHLLGRSKDLVITGGLNVYPKEVEQVLDDLPGVRESAVVGLEDADLGEVVVAVVVGEPGAALDPEAVRAAARAHLAGYKVPKRVHLVDALPRNAMGKVQKADLRARLRTSDS